MKRNKKIIICAGIVVIGLMIIIYTPLLMYKPLEFAITNYDVENHEVTVVIFDTDGKLIFNETYMSSPGIPINSKKIVDKRGDYLFKVRLDDNITDTIISKKEFGRVSIFLCGYEDGKICGSEGGKNVPIRILQFTN
ncbi:MAG: hypothetical protein K0A89_03585 [ANME-2 cluster archaeon]|nr:hypothetical protein [ANME-2 cluster archaeon]